MGPPKGNALSEAEKTAVIALRNGRLGYAEMWAWTALRARNGRPTALSVLGAIAHQIGLPQMSVRFLEQAAAINPTLPGLDQNLQLARAEAAREQARGSKSNPTYALQSKRYLIIKAWGHGFWSDVSHVAVSALLAELTGRIPVVHWGASSLYNAAPPVDCFAHYFEPLSEVAAADLMDANVAIFPDSWNVENLFGNGIGAEPTAESYIPASHFLPRPEAIAVVDHHTSLAALRGWIPQTNPLAGMSLDELWLRQFRTAIKPLAKHRRHVSEFIERQFASEPYIAFHCRGTDKLGEDPTVVDYVAWAERTIGELTDTLGSIPVFLMTEQESMIRYFGERFGTRLRFTDAARTSDDLPVHRNPRIADRYRLGTDALTEALIASNAVTFVGLGSSNLSCAVAYLRSWPTGRCHLFGTPQFSHVNLLLDNVRAGEIQKGTV